MARGLTKIAMSMMLAPRERSVPLTLDNFIFQPSSRR